MRVRAEKVHGVFAFHSRIRAEDRVRRLVFFSHVEAQLILRRAPETIRGLGLRVCADNETGSDEREEGEDANHVEVGDS